MHKKCKIVGYNLFDYSCAYRFELVVHIKFNRFLILAMAGIYLMVIN